MAATLLGVAAMAEGEGTQSDPLVTLSYIDRVFTDYKMGLFQDKLDTKAAELESGDRFESSGDRTGPMARRGNN
jgi:hypothetical protein